MFASANYFLLGHHNGAIIFSRKTQTLRYSSQEIKCFGNYSYIVTLLVMEC